MIERAAKALARQDALQRTTFFRHPGKPEDLANWQTVDGYAGPDDWVRDTWTFKVSAARAVVEAMRDRSEAMLDAGTAVLWPQAQQLAPGSTAVAVYEAMIDAALSGRHVEKVSAIALEGSANGRRWEIRELARTSSPQSITHQIDQFDASGAACSRSWEDSLAHATQYAEDGAEVDGHGSINWIAPNG